MLLETTFTQLCCGNGRQHYVALDDFNATRTNRATTLSKTCNTLPQRDVALKVALFCDTDFSVTMSCLKSAIKIGSRNFTVIRHDSKAFRKRALSRRNLKTLEKKKPFENGDYAVIQSRYSPARVLLKQIQNDR